MLTWILFIAAAFFAGSIPFALLIGLARGVDIRKHGSGNVGASNAGRVLGKPWGMACFVCDAGKGAAPVIAAGLTLGWFGGDPTTLDAASQWQWIAVAVAAVLGHMFTPFLKFRGGKGVATGFGGMVAMWNVLTIPLLVALVIWIVVLRAFRFISVASMTAAASAPVTFLILLLARPGETPLVDRLVNALGPIVLTTALAALIAWRHRSNIGRLRRGEEPRYDEKKANDRPAATSSSEQS